MISRIKDYTKVYVSESTNDLLLKLILVPSCDQVWYEVYKKNYNNKYECVLRDFTHGCYINPDLDWLQPTEGKDNEEINEYTNLVSDAIFYSCRQANIVTKSDICLWTFSQELFEFLINGTEPK